MSARRLDPSTSYVYGISVPNVRAEHPSLRSQQLEWDQFEIADVDMTHLPVLANHKDHMQRVGEIAAYEPLKGEARVLMALDKDTFYGQFAEAAVSTDFYGSMSLSHHYRTSANVAASATAEQASSGCAPTDIVTRKTAIEVSLCKQPARPGAVVLEFCPSTDALLRQPHEYLRRFAERYKYPPPPDVPMHPRARGLVTERIALNTPVLNEYVTKKLSPLVAARLTELVDNAQFVCSTPILAPAATQRATVNDGRVRMSNNAAGSNGGQSVPPTTTQTPASGNGNSMAVDAPTPTQTSQSSSASTPAGNSMALDPPKSSTSTEASKRVDLGSASSATPDAAELLATLHANNQAMKAQLDHFMARERAAKEAEEAEKKRIAAEKVKEDDLVAQSAISHLADLNKFSAADRQRLHEARATVKASAAALGIADEQVNTLMRPMIEAMVQASKKARTDETARAEAALSEQVRIIHEQIKASKSSATMHGGMSEDRASPYLQPPSPAEGRVLASNSSSSSSSSSMTTPDAATLSRYGLTPEEFKRHTTVSHSSTPASSTTTNGDDMSEGRVDASKGTATSGRGNSRLPGSEEIKADDPDAIGKVYASLCKLMPDGSVELPSYDEVAQGGFVREARVKRSADGAQQQFEVVVPRWPDKKKIGLQHLFPAAAAKMNEPLFNYEAKLDDAVLKKAVAIGKAQAAMNIIPPLQSRRRKGNYQKQFYYCDPKRRGTEEQSYMDIPPGEVFADGTPCV